MKLLLTSAGASNPSIRDALVGLLGKAISESSALFIPTAIYALQGGTVIAGKEICGEYSRELCGLGWKSLGILELTALPSIKEEQWLPTVRQTDALLVGGGDPLYLSYWMRRSGLADLLPSLLSKTVYVGLSAGSMVMTPNFAGENYGGINLTIADDSGLGLVDFSLFPHLDHEKFPENSLANAELWAAKIPLPTYAIDDQTAIRVTDGTVDVISEGHWKLFNP
jgi:dipeptidase E